MTVLSAISIGFPLKWGWANATPLTNRFKTSSSRLLCPRLEFFNCLCPLLEFFSPSVSMAARNIKAHRRVQVHFQPEAIQAQNLHAGTINFCLWLGQLARSAGRPLLAFLMSTKSSTSVISSFSIKTQTLRCKAWSSAVSNFTIIGLVAKGQSLCPFFSLTKVRWIAGYWNNFFSTWNKRQLEIGGQARIEGSFYAIQISICRLPLRMATAIFKMALSNF